MRGRAMTRNVSMNLRRHPTSTSPGRSQECAAPRKLPSGFTLIELLVVVAIIALLISILLPALKRAKDHAREVVCRSNLRQLAVAWLMYANDWNGVLPGSTWDYQGYPMNPNTITTWCWLGTFAGGGGDNQNFVPKKGSIFRYINDQDKAYKCPEDKLDSRAWNGGTARTKTLYSYTAPSMLSGAPLALLNHTLFPHDFPANFTQDTPGDEWKKYARTSLPWMIIEEDEGASLNFVVDSAWGNLDRVTDRHRGKGSIAHTDGSVSNRKYQNSADKNYGAYVPLTLVANMVFYDLTDGRRIGAGQWYDSQGNGLKFGAILNKAWDLGW